MSLSPNDSLRIQDFASLFGFEASHVIAAVEAQRYRLAKSQALYTVHQLPAANGGDDGLQDVMYMARAFADKQIEAFGL
jgi:hypothetical protein